MHPRKRTYPYAIVSTLLLSLVACGPSTPDDGPTGDDDSGASPYPYTSPTPLVTPSPTPFPDNDGDGFAANLDCNDDDPTVNPNAVETCDGIDNDCDDLIDDYDPDITENVSGTVPVWYLDRDNDGYGDPSAIAYRCTQPAGHVDRAGDCNDDDPAFNPDAVEDDCTNPNDYNCDGVTLYADDDGDGYPACVECNDQDPAIHPDAPETCDHIDNDCDGAIDDDDPDVQDRTAWYLDSDEDGFGENSSETLACFAPSAQYRDTPGDCNDQDPTFFPGAPLGCDDRDHDCDGLVDNDADGDGFADPYCGGGDCDDTNPSAHPDDGSCALAIDVLIGDNDGFGFGIPDGADLNTAEDFTSLQFDNRTSDDPDFTDFGDDLRQAGPLAWTATFDIGYRNVTGVTLMMDVAGIQDGVTDTCSQLDDRLVVDGNDVPGAFDDTDLGAYGTRRVTFDLTTLVPDVLRSAGDGILEFEFDVDRSVTLPPNCGEYFSIDFVRVSITADRTLE